MKIEHSVDCMREVISPANHNAAGSIGDQYILFSGSIFPPETLIAHLTY